ncbi:MAG: YbaB/EbfC family nucleoid-associated protein [Planctomycetota bacterium]
MSLGDMGQLLQHAQKMQKELRAVQEDLKNRTVKGEAGGGMVKAYFNGQQEALKFEVEPDAVDPEDIGMLEDLLLVAVRNGLEKSKELSTTEMGRVTGGLSLPGLF